MVCQYFYLLTIDEYLHIASPRTKSSSSLNVVDRDCHVRPLLRLNQIRLLVLRKGNGTCTQEDHNAIVSNGSSTTLVSSRNFETSTLQYRSVVRTRRIDPKLYGKCREVGRVVGSRHCIPQTLRRLVYYNLVDQFIASFDKGL